MQPNQVEIDEALAASLLYDDPESTICDAVTLSQIQQQQVMIPPLSVWPTARPERFFCPYCPIPYPHGHDNLPFVCLYCPIPYFHVHDCPPSREAFTGHSYGNSSTDMYRRGFSDIGSSSGHGDSENMTVEVVNELIEPVGDVNKGLSQSKVSRLPTHKYGETPKLSRWWWEKKKKFVADDSQCSICLIDYEKGDRITTLTPCNHIYHTDCISEWLKKSTVCCVCKRKVYC